MAPAKEKALPASMTVPETGVTLTRDVRSFVVAYKSEGITVELPGYYPAGAGEGVHVGNDMLVVDEALRLLKSSMS
jgi:HTH-type transcriptional regulator / antitoxin MqsA